MPLMTSASIEVFLLKKEQELSSSIWNYFFVCKVVGSTLQWEANNLSLPGFTPGENGAVRSSTKGMLAYSAVLLQDDQESDGENILTSMLIISSPELPQVICFNGTHSSMSTGTVSQLQSFNRSVANSSNAILLQHIFSEVIVQGMNAPPTHAFLCRVEAYNQTWTINNGLRYGFSEVNNIGDVLPPQSSTEPITEELAFLHAKSPIYTFLLVTKFCKNVICMSNGPAATSLTCDASRFAMQQTSPTPLLCTKDESSSCEGTTFVEGTMKDNYHMLPVGGVAAGVVASVVLVTAMF